MSDAEDERFLTFGDLLGELQAILGRHVTAISMVGTDAVATFEGELMNAPSMEAGSPMEQYDDDLLRIGFKSDEAFAYHWLSPRLFVTATAAPGQIAIMFRHYALALTYTL